MDTMQEWEVFEYTNIIEYSNYISWNQTRLIMYIIAQANSRKKLKLKDICILPWENNKEKEEHNIEISNEDKNRLKNKVDQIIQSGVLKQLEDK